MRIQASAFPEVYLNAICTKHDCVVVIRVSGVTNPRVIQITGAVVTAMRCEKGGSPDPIRDTCEDSWQMNISTPGGVTLPAQ